MVRFAAAICKPNLQDSLFPEVEALHCLRLRMQLKKPRRNTASELLKVTEGFGDGQNCSDSGTPSR
jgi:hypothetical protein